MPHKSVRPPKSKSWIECAHATVNCTGLIIFDSNVDYTCPLTQVLEDFRDHVEEGTSSPPWPLPLLISSWPNFEFVAGAEGETKLYDALKKAASELAEFKKDHENAKLRILCLTDGEDTKSTGDPVEVAGLLQKHQIICDSIMIGEGANNKTLRAISKATGGYAFAPKTLADALKLNELETLLTLFERPEIKPRDSVKTAAALNKYADLWVYSVRRFHRDSHIDSSLTTPSPPLRQWDICNDETVPQRRVPAELKAAVLPLDKTVSKVFLLLVCVFDLCTWPYMFPPPPYSLEMKVVVLRRAKLKAVSVELW